MTRLFTTMATTWILLLASCVWASPTPQSYTNPPRISAPQTYAACLALRTALPGRLHLPNSPAYETENADYWSVALREVRPACIVMPTSAQEVSTVVTVLRQHDGVAFAVKSGGGTPSAGVASSDGGIVVALKNIQGTTYDAKTQLATISPGDRWGAPLRYLERYGRTVVSGRLSTLGVGGVTSEGGLSYLSSKHGLAADSVVEWETVLANGTIAHINAATQPELARALRGGGSQFGIHTRFTVKTYEQPRVYVGIRVFKYSARAQLFDALTNFVETNSQNQDAAILLMSGYGTWNIMSALALVVWTGGPTPPKGAFGQLEDVPTWLSLGLSMKYSTAHSLSDPIINTVPLRADFKAFPVPHKYGDNTWYRRIDDVNTNVAARYIKGKATMLNFMVFAPWPKSLAAASEAAGGNAMALTGRDPDRVMLEIVTVWARQADDNIATNFGNELVAALGQTVKAEREEQTSKDPSKLMGTYNPMCMNDAGSEQDVFGTWKDVKQLRRLQREMDPDRFWTDRAGGFKFRPGVMQQQSLSA